MSVIKAVLFDLDGTLANTIYDLAEGVNYALSKNGYPTRQTEEFYYFVGDGAIKMIERALPESVRSEQLAYQLRKDFLEYYSCHSMDNTCVYYGVPELLDKLFENNIKVAVVTNKPDLQAKEMVNRLYPDRFDVVLGQKDSVPTKPDPTLALAAMKQLGVEPEQCVFVGDSGVDMQTGVNCGAVSVGVLWGVRTEEELRENGADYIISTPDMLLNIIGE